MSVRVFVPFRDYATIYRVAHERVDKNREADVDENVYANENSVLTRLEENYKKDFLGCAGEWAVGRTWGLPPDENTELRSGTCDLVMPSTVIEEGQIVIDVKTNSAPNWCLQVNVKKDERGNIVPLECDVYVCASTIYRVAPGERYPQINAMMIHGWSPAHRVMEAHILNRGYKDAYNLPLKKPNGDDGYYGPEDKYRVVRGTGPVQHINPINSTRPIWEHLQFLDLMAPWLEQRN
jgi:hypothetical protein